MALFLESVWICLGQLLTIAMQNKASITILTITYSFKIMLRMWSLQ